VRGRHQAEFERELAASKLFAALSVEQVHELARSATRVHEPKGMVFSKEGERGDELVVLLEGTVEVRRDGAVLAALGPGEHFGELALLDDTARRSAMVVAVTPVVVGYLSRHHFDAILAANPSVRDAVVRVVRERQVAEELPSALPFELRRDVGE
jgi:CRP-like cAMP-binding protein